MESIKEQARECIDSHAKQAVAVSFIPFVSIPIVYGVCAKMIVRLDGIFGIPTAKGWDSEIVHDIMAGIIAAPALAIPFLGAGVASVYIKSIGENYARAVSTVLETATPEQHTDPVFLSRRVKEELHKNYAAQRKNRRRRMEKG
ncbi:MAG: hypothetical protein FWB88_13045 [Defluviitaleaceae bacterium]|nr:hypothetical protein [Defluviitaleaceae bacterium]MCL2240749.1 hypothetical protein [Defluviitaleaceae bacterium]